MARKVTVTADADKAQLMTTTTISNVMPVVYSHADIMAIANQGFEDKHTADDLNGTATQRVAFACFASWVDWRSNGHPDDEAVNDIDCILLTDDSSKSKTKSLKSQFVAALIPAKPDDFDQWEADAQAQWTIKNNARKTLLGRAMIAAAVVRKAGCSVNDFNRSKGVFSCKAAMLIEKGVEATGFLAKMILADETVVLNNGGYSGEKRNKANTGNMPVRIKASVDQLRTAIASHVASVAALPEKIVKVDLKKANGKTLAGAPLERLIEAVYILLIDDPNKPLKLFPRSSMPEEIWTKLADITFANDALIAHHKAQRERGIVDAAA